MVPFWFAYIALMLIVIGVALRWPLMGVVCLALLVMGTVAFFMITENPRGWPLLVFSVLVISVALFVSRGQADKAGMWYAFIRVMFTCVIWIALVCVLLVAFTSFYAWLLALAVAVMMIRYHLSTRRAVAATVISTLSAGVRQRMPLANALAAAAYGRTDRTARILHGLSHRLATGMTLSDAILDGWRQCPGLAVGMIQAGERSGQLGEALVAIEAELDDDIHHARRVGDFQAVYPIVLLGVMTFVTLGIGLFILPKFRRIFESFEAELPALSRFMLDVMGPEAWVLSLVLGGVALIGLIVALRALFRPRRPHRPRLLSVLGDYITWYLPPWCWHERRMSLWRATEGIRMALAGGQTVDRAIAAAMRLDTNERFRSRLASWHKRVTDGEDIAASAVESGIGASLAWAFNPRANPNRAPEALKLLADSLDNAGRHHRRIVQSILWPVTTLVLGLLVGLVALAVLGPLPGLIQSMCGDILP